MSLFKNWVATQSAQVILIFKRFGERWRQKGKRENDEATLPTYTRKRRENVRKHSYIHEYYRSKMSKQSYICIKSNL